MRPDQLAGEVLKRTAETVSSFRRQVPAARMIGEFAVKHLAKEVEKLSRRFSSGTGKSHTDVEHPSTDES